MKAIIWSKPDCPKCVSAQTLLSNRGYDVEERKLGFGWNREQLFDVVPNVRSVPQIFIDEKYVGGLEDLEKYLSKETK